MADKVKIVVNRVGLDNGQITLKKAEETIGKEIFWQLPNDYRTMIEARNNGVPLIEQAPKAAITQSIVAPGRGAFRRREREAGRGGRQEVRPRRPVQALAEQEREVALPCDSRCDPPYRAVAARVEFCASPAVLRSADRSLPHCRGAFSSAVANRVSYAFLSWPCVSRNRRERSFASASIARDRMS